MKSLGRVLLLVWGLLFALGAGAQEATVDATVEANEVGVGEQFQLSVRVTSKDDLELQAPRIPPMDGFALLNTFTSESVSRNLVSGPGGMEFKTQRSTIYTYLLQATKKGRLQIPPFEPIVNGKPRPTKPIVMNVTDAGAAPSGRGNPGGAGIDDSDDPLNEADRLFQELLQRRGMMPGGPGQQVPGGGGSGGGSAFVPKNPNDAFVVHVDADKSEVFEGEQITASWYVMVRGNILNLDRAKFPDLKGFWKETIEEPTSLSFAVETINGIVYRKALLSSFALFPIKPGTIIIDEYRLKATMQVSQNPYGSFGFGPTYTFSRASEPVKVKVKPLPAEGKPGNFTGAVGQFDVTAATDGQSFAVNQPFSLKVRFEGAGNAKLIELPAYQAPAGIEVYETKSESKFFKNGRSYKEFEILLIPRKAGPVELPAIAVALFDPRTAQYYTRSTEAIKIDVKEGAAGAGQSTRVAPDAAKAVVAEPAGPQLPALMIGASAPVAVPPFANVVTQILALILLGFRGFFELRKESHLTKTRRRVRARMKAIEKLLAGNDWRATAKETTNLLYLVLGEISGKGGANEELQKLLAESPPSVRRELGKDLERIVETFQTLSFAPEAAIGELKEPARLRRAVEEAEALAEKALTLAAKVD